MPPGAGLAHMLQAPDFHAQQAMLVLLQSFSPGPPPVDPPVAQLRRPPSRRLGKRLSVHRFLLLRGRVYESNRLRGRIRPEHGERETSVGRLDHCNSSARKLGAIASFGRKRAK